jgi:hypothetical protein
LADSSDREVFRYVMALIPNMTDAEDIVQQTALELWEKVDAKQHTVLMMQVENEVGIRDDSRDGNPVANAAFAQPVPKELMRYLVQHKNTLAPELRELWAANGNKTSGPWEEVFGPGKPPSVKLFDRAMTQQEKDRLWRELSWPVDETILVDGRWVPVRRLNGDKTDHSRRWPGMRSFGIYRYTIYQRK